MGTSIQTFIDMCQWDTTSFLIFSNNVFDPLIYYSHLVPLILSLILAIFIFKGSYKLLVSKVLFGTILLLSFWIFADSILWATNNPKITMFLWSLVNMVEPIIYAGILYFLYLFIDQKDISFYKKLVIVILLLPTILLTSTNFALVGFDLTNCNRDAIEGPLVYYGYFVEILFIIWILFFTTKRFIFTKYRDQQEAICLMQKVFEADSWIVEGTTKKLYEFGLGSSDIIIHLRYKNIPMQWLHLIKRSVGRESETFAGLYKLMKHVLFKKYKFGYRKGKPTPAEIIDPYKHKVVTFSSFKEINSFINCL